MGLDRGRSIGMPKSLSESSSKLEFSDSEFVLGVKFKGGIDMGDGGRERDGDLGGGDGDVEGGDGDMGSGDGDLGVGIFAYFAKQGEFWERVGGDWYCRGTHTL